MARTICQIPTSLSGDDLAARLEMFLHYYKFKKTDYYGEELYKVSSWLWGSGYLKIIHEDGFLHVEAFYLTGKYKWERKIDATIPTDPHDMRGKLRELSKIIGSSLPLNSSPTEQIAGQQQPYNSVNDQSDNSDFGFHEFNEQHDAKRRNSSLTGCWIIGLGCLIIFALPLCLLIGAFLYGIFLGLFFPDQLNADEEPPDEINAAVSIHRVGHRV